MTNYEQIKNMNIKDMAEALYTSKCFYCIYFCGDCEERSEYCINGIAQWLKQEIETMEIKNKDNKVRIGSIGDGTVFKDGHGLFLKVEYNDDSGINAVRLEDGKPCYFSWTTEVEEIDCELVVK